ncbi:outer membrane protein assembly factor BamA [Paracoccus pacificus]|uniref:Outer membrane protein assembly factor BamA n=1 Tax=Paracoccus pacificus TaxID=1463598 RepID=A0ABW4R4W1_9RHOB
MTRSNGRARGPAAGNRRSSRTGLGRAAALVTAISLAVPVGFVPAPAAAFVFNSIRIEGNQRIEPQTIISYANIPRGAQVSAGQVNDAVQRLQNSGLFETVEIIPQGSTLVIRVSEYPTINVISIEGNRRIKDEQLSSVIKSQANRVFSPATAESDAEEMAKVYASQGRLAARIDPKVIRRANNRVDLVFEVREGDVTEIERITFTGNRTFSDRRLRQVLETKQAGLLRAFIKRDTYLPDRIGLDERLLTDFYRSRGYADFKVQGIAPEIARERDAFFITFNIQEGPRYTFGNVNVISEIPGVDAAPFSAQNRVRPGQVYNPTDIDNSIRRMESVAIQQGQNFVNIEPRITRNLRNQTLDLTFALTRGPRIFVERIDIEGNTTTLDEVIRRQFNTVEGDPFNPREIRNAAERVRALGYFSDAQVQSREGSTPQQVIVDVNVEEQPTGSLTFGVSYGANTGAGFNAALSEQNFLGRGQQVQLSFSTGRDNQNSSFTFVEPYFLGRDLKAKFSTWYITTDRQNAEYNTRSAGISPALEFPVSQNGRLELRYKLSKDTLFDVDPIHTDPEDGKLVGSSPILKREEGSRWTSALGYSYTYDTRITKLDPETNYVLRWSQDFAGVGGDVKSVTSSLFAGVESTAWRPEVTLTGQFEAGAIHMLSNQKSRVTDRFKGAAKIRGFAPGGMGPRDLAAPNKDVLGGNFFWVARAEARFPIGLPEEYGIQGGLFADIGSVWGLDDRDGANGVQVDDRMHVRATVGVSMFWDTPIGPLRFNLSKALKKEDYDKAQSFDLTIQSSF